MISLGRRAAIGLFFIQLLACAESAYADDVVRSLAPDGKPILEVSANPSKGFRFPYLLYIPATARLHPFPYLLVETNNTPDSSQNITDLTKDTSAAIRELTSFSLGNGVAERLGAPFLIPIFPRPMKADGADIYTFSLSREAFLIANGPLRRIDLQLAAMIADAKHRLASRGEAMQSKIMMTGFSASAMFASRFVFLHPELVKAAAFGAVNSFFMLPMTEMAGHKLEFPLGIADYQNLTGQQFAVAAYREVHEFVFMGANDNNDAVLAGGGDAYSADESSLVFDLFGRHMMPERWQALEQAYGKDNPQVAFHTYNDIGHGLDVRLWDDVSDFFQQQAKE